jgi:hypothetical protein
VVETGPLENRRCRPPTLSASDNVWVRCR